MPIQFSKSLCTNPLPAALPWKAVGEGVGVVVDDEVVLIAEVELPVASINTPPAMVGGETEVVFLAAVL